MVSRRAWHSLPPVAAALALSAALVACVLEPADAPPPAAPRSPAPTASATPVSATPGGYYGACALTESGELFCWDMDDAGEAIVLPGRYIAIDTAGGKICAVTAGGDTVCWGADASAAGDPP